jgi:hypothetical protein
MLPQVATGFTVDKKTGWSSCLGLSAVALAAFATATFVTAAFVTATTVAHAETLKVSSDFEGASVKLLGIDQTTREITFTSGGDAARGWPCWWYFRIDGVTPGESISLRLRGSKAVQDKPNAKPLARRSDLVGRRSDMAAKRPRNEGGRRDGLRPSPLDVVAVCRVGTAMHAADRGGMGTPVGGELAAREGRRALSFP